MCLRLAAHREPFASGEVSVYGSDLLGYVRKGLAEKLEPLLFDFLEIVLGSLGPLSGVFEVFVRGLESVLDHFKSLDSTHVWSHMVQFIVQGVDLLL